MNAALDLVRAHAALLPLIIAMCGAALAMLCPPRLSWGVAALTAALAAVLTLDTALRTLIGGVQIMDVAEGVPLLADGITLFAAPLLALVAALVIVASGAMLRSIDRQSAPVAMALMMCQLTGWLCALTARDLAGVFVAMETAWLASVAMLALGPVRTSLAGALRMLSAGGVGSALFLCGAGLLYRSIGSLDLSHFAEALIESGDAAALGAGLMLIGVALKAGIAPLHDWMGAAFTRPGGPASLALGAFGVIGATALVVRLAGYVVAAPAIGEGVSIALAVLGGVSVVIGSVQAVGAHNLVRLAAYAGAAQAGGVLLCVALGSPAGFAAALVQLSAFAAAALALFGGAAAGGVQTLSQLDGLGRRAPLAGAAIMTGAISLMGAPLTLGFLGRWRFVEAGVGAGWWWAAGAVIFASLAGVFYGGRIIERLYFRHAGDVFLGPGDAWRWALSPLLAASIVIIVLGVAPAFLLSAADAAAGRMLGVAP